MKKIVQPNNSRGVGFPRLFLSSSISVMEQASKFGRQWSKQTFANYGKYKGKGSLKSGAFANRIASLKDFGLIEVVDDLITRTPLTDKILNPINDKERKGAIEEAFLNATVFKQLVDTVKKGDELSKDEIAAYAVNQLHVSRASKDKFLTSFIQSGQYAGMVKKLENGNIKIEIPSEPQSANQTTLTSTVDRLTEHSPKTQAVLNPDVATTLGTRKAGMSWEVNLLIRFNLNANPKMFQEMTALVLKAESLAKTFRAQEGKGTKEENGQPTDNESEA